jgi:hypothetical protein
MLLKKELDNDRRINPLKGYYRMYGKILTSNINMIRQQQNGFGKEQSCLDCCIFSMTRLTEEQSQLNSSTAQHF